MKTELADYLNNEATKMKARQRVVLDTANALQVVIALARQNVIDEQDNPEEHARQVAACDIVEDLAVNEYGDD